MKGVKISVVQLAETREYTELQDILSMNPLLAKQKDEFGMTTLHWLCTDTKVPLSVLKCAILSYPSATKIENYAGLLPLHLAVRKALPLDAFRLLLHHHPKAILSETPSGKTAVELSLEYITCAKTRAYLSSVQRDVSPTLRTQQIPRKHRQHHVQERAGSYKEKQQSTQDISRPRRKTVDQPPTFHTIEKSMESCRSTEASTNTSMSINLVQEETTPPMPVEPPVKREQPPNKQQTTRLPNTIAPAWRNNKTCHVCYVKFGVFKKRHHCRNCGESVCGKHSKECLPLKHLGLGSSEQRVCSLCFNRLQAYYSARALGLSHSKHPLATDPALFYTAQVTFLNEQNKGKNGNASTSNDKKRAPSSVSSHSTKSSQKNASIESNFPENREKRSRSADDPSVWFNDQHLRIEEDMKTRKVKKSAQKPKSADNSSSNQEKRYREFASPNVNPAYKDTSIDRGYGRTRQFRRADSPNLSKKPSSNQSSLGISSSDVSIPSDQSYVFNDLLLKKAIRDVKVTEKLAKAMGQYNSSEQYEDNQVRNRVTNEPLSGPKSNSFQRFELLSSTDNINKNERQATLLHKGISVEVDSLPLENAENGNSNHKVVSNSVDTKRNVKVSNTEVPLLNLAQQKKDYEQLVNKFVQTNLHERNSNKENISNNELKLHLKDLTISPTTDSQDSDSTRSEHGINIDDLRSEPDFEFEISQTIEADSMANESARIATEYLSKLVLENTDYPDIENAPNGWRMDYPESLDCRPSDASYASSYQRGSYQLAPENIEIAQSSDDEVSISSYILARKKQDIDNMNLGSGNIAHNKGGDIPSTLVVANFNSNIGNGDSSVFFDVVETHHELGLVFLKQNNFASAVFEFRRAIDLSTCPSGAMWYYLAQALDGAREYKDAEDAILKALALDGKSLPSLTLLGKILHSKGKHDEAIDVFREALASRHNSPATAW